MVLGLASDDAFVIVWNVRAVLIFSRAGAREAVVIQDHAIAKQVVGVLDACSKEIDATIRLVQENCTTEEFEAYRKAAGFVMGYIYTEVVAPLHHAHPDLEEPELRE